jgi:hypothetical protein
MKLIHYVSIDDVILKKYFCFPKQKNMKDIIILHFCKLFLDIWLCKRLLSFYTCVWIHCVF